MKLRFAYMFSMCVGLTLLLSLVPAVATLANGVPGSSSVGTIGSTLSVGPISVSLTSGEYDDLS